MKLKSEHFFLVQIHAKMAVLIAIDGTVVMLGVNLIQHLGKDPDVLAN